MSKDYNILIVEDKSYWAEKLKESLLTAGYMDIVICNNERDALKVITCKSFNVIIVDLNLLDHVHDPAEYGGIRIISETSKLNNSEKIRFVVVTGYYESKVEELLRKYGVKHVFLKQDFNSIEFSQSINRILSTMEDESN